MYRTYKLVPAMGLEGVWDGGRWLAGVEKARPFSEGACGSIVRTAANASRQALWIEDRYVIVIRTTYTPPCTWSSSCTGRNTQLKCKNVGLK